MPLPNSHPWMESADAKMIRAHENIEGIDREIDVWLKSITMNTILKTSADRGWPWLVVYASDYNPPIRISVLVGECVHNMRSAIDSLVCGLALTLDPKCTCAKLAFPVLSNQQEWDKRADESLKGIPPAAKEVIRQLQPWASMMSPHPLTILTKISNIDKHRLCNIMLAHIQNATFHIHCDNGDILEVNAERPLYLGDVDQVPLPMDKRLIENGARVQASGEFAVTFREESDWDHLPVMQVLRDCFDHVERKVMGGLKPFLERP